MRLAPVLVALAPALAGCKSLLGIDDLTLAADADPAGDVPSDVDPARCLGGGLISVCPEPPPTAGLSVAGMQVLDTENEPTCITQMSGNLEVCVLLRTSINVAAGATLRVTGKRPLVLASTSTLVVRGTIDASSVLQKPPGGGGNPALCMPGAMSGATGAGGAGGSYGGRGGRGGDNGSQPAAPVPLDHIQGGCPGSRGVGSQLAAGGAGGGAVYLIAKEQIVVDGAINASGAAGDASTGAGFGSNGGGGGGAGGLIGLDAPTISGGGTLFANGGGGGSGSSTLFPGMPGTESPSATVAGRGGTSNNNGNGGDGSLGSQLDGRNGLDGMNAGGGGGGGAGMIYVHGAYSITGPVSPPPRMQ